MISKYIYIFIYLLRTLRETAALRKGLLRMGHASDCRFYAKGVRKIGSKDFSADERGDRRQVFRPQKCHPNGRKKTSKIHTNSDQKSMKHVSGGTLEHQKAPTGVQSCFSIDLFALPGLPTTSILTFFEFLLHFFGIELIIKQWCPPKTICFMFLHFL